MAKRKKSCRYKISRNGSTVSCHRTKAAAKRAYSRLAIAFVKEVHRHPRRHPTKHGGYARVPYTKSW